MNVLAVLEEHYGLDGVELFALGGELDRNTAVLTADGSRVVVKVSRSAVARIRWQHELMRLAAAGVLVPSVRPTIDGGSFVVVDDGVVTVQSWLDGTLLSELDSHAPELLEELGVTAARLVRALDGAPEPPDAPGHWDVLRAVEAVGGEGDDDVRRLLTTYSRALARHGSALPRTVVHQDLNDFNVLAERGPDGRHHVHAVLDFGDALRTARVGELAVAVAYAMLRKPDPLTAAAAVVRGYTAEAALEDAELAVLFPFAAARLCVNAVTWTRRGGAYGHERMRHTRPAIAALAATPPELAEAVVREAAGQALPPAYFEPCAPVRRTTVGGEPATLRLGVEAPARTPLDAVVESTEPVLLKHDFVWSRWTGVTTPHCVGDVLSAGDRVGRGTATVALFRSKETALLAPDAVIASQAAAWAQVSPDPAPFLGAPGRERPWDTGRVLATREAHFARSQRSYYRRPMNLAGGEGAWLHDDAGRAYLDAINNVSHVGHANPRVVAAATAQLRKLNTNSRFVYPGIAEYAERLTATLPAPLAVAFLVCSGSEANDLAVRMARQVTGRRDVLVVDGAYHGNTAVLTGLSPNRYKGPGGTGPDPATHEVEQPNRYRGHGDPAAYAEDVRRQVARISPAAFLAESVLGTAGSVFYPDGYLAEAYATVRAAGGLCVADEVQVGFGRLGDVFWGFESQGVVPDIVTMGKPIGNGHPMAAVVTTREIADAFDSGMKYFNTFGGNPVSCAIGTAVLDEIAERGLQEHALKTGRHFKTVLDELADRHELIGDVRGHGMYLGVELVRDRGTKEPAGAEALHVSELMKDEGVLVYPTGPGGNVLKIKPPLPFTTADADLFATVLDEVLGRAW